MGLMKAAVIHRFHEIQLDWVLIPEPGADEVLIKLTYCGICGSDMHIYHGQHPTATPAASTAAASP